jgi:hypothetical protein
MSAINSIEPVELRKAKIANAEPQNRLFSLRYKSRTEELDVKRVAISALIYRVANMRTSVRQRECIVQQSLSVTFFSAGQENLETQQIQHSILVELSHDSRADIFAELQRTADQTEPLLVTTFGVVVNGNRRLAAMRELLHSDPARFSSFSHIDVAVLPLDADEDTLSEIETALQIRPDLRSPYGWIEEALGLRTQIDELGWDYEKAATVWGASVSDLKDRLKNLLLAEQYLEYLNAPGDYGRVSDDMQAIETFSKAQGSRTATCSASRKEFQKLVMFAVLKEDVQDRKYSYAKDIDAISKEIERHFDAPTRPNPTEIDPDDPLGGMPAHVDDVPEGLLEMARDVSYSEELAQLAETSWLEIKTRRSAEKKGRQLLQASTDALAKLSGLSLTDNDKATYLPTLKKLISIHCETAKIMNLLLKEKPDLAKDIDLGERNPLREVIATINELNRLAS